MAPDSAETSRLPGMAEYYQRLERAHLAPLWESLAALAPPEPRPQALPFQWRYDQARTHLLEAGRLISAEQAERRVVILANPGVPGGSQITDTLYAGLQLILPGEIAPAHRHTQSALRFVLEGVGAYTAVDGEKVMMAPGDFIITPAWSWHDHGGGDGPVIWMDGLDVPLVGFLHAEFREEHASKAQATTDVRSTFAWPYAEARAALEAMKAEVDPCHGVRREYLHPDGRPAMPTIGAALSLLPEGFRGRPYKSTDGAVVCLVEGRVLASVGEEHFTLEPKDVLALPGWRPWRFTALQESVLFSFSDRPAHQALGLWRERRGESA
jgi:gentisate 1,2-dioxygenase